MFIRLPRASSSGHRLSETDAAVVKGMLLRGDRQSDIAAHFCVNSGRIAEINKGMRFAEVLPETKFLPPPGPYMSQKLAALVDGAILATSESHVVRLLKICQETGYGHPSGR